MGLSSISFIPGSILCPKLHFSFPHPSHSRLVYITLLYYLHLFLVVPKIFWNKWWSNKIYYVFLRYEYNMHTHKFKTIHLPSFFLDCFICCTSITTNSGLFALTPLTGILLVGIYPNTRHLELYTKGHCCLYQKSPQMETSPMSLRRWTDFLNSGVPM